MNPTERLLRVMEYLMAAGPDPVKQVDIARDLNMSPATLSRITKTLSDRGYLFRTSERYCVRNFRLTRNVPMSENYLNALNSLLEEITEKHQVSAEAVVATGFDLLWHSKTELPDASVSIRATVGYRRNLYELDALARLYLSRIPWEEISYKFFKGVFFNTGVNMQPLSPDDAKGIIESCADTNFAFDMDGNHVGVRRFATIIEDDSGNFLHLLSIAEAAVPVRDRKEKIASSIKILADARERLKQHIAEESNLEEGRQYELRPPQIG